MAVVSGLLAPFVGRWTDRMHPRVLAGIGLVSWSVALVWLAAVMGPATPIWELLLPIALLGVANGFVWAPVSTTATRNLPRADAGAGSGVYNTTRQIGAVLGSAAIAVLIASRLSAELPAAPGGGAASESITKLPEVLHADFATAMAQALLLPAGVVLVGFVAALGFALPRHLARRGADPVQQVPSSAA
jgi:MFS family permease